MMRGMYAAISGLKNHQTMLDVTANDIANVNTIGYKSARTTFKDAMSQTQRGGNAPNAAQGGSNPAQVGLGAQLGSIDNIMTDGSFQSTGRVLDVGIQGDGFFTLSQMADGSGTPQYTRAGNFTTNRDGQLVTQDGYFVRGYTANQGPPATPTTTTANLTIPATATNLAIGQDGSVSYIDSGTGNRVTAGFLQLTKFANPAGLERNAGNRWVGSPNAGPPQSGAPGTDGLGLTNTGVLEMSNVDLAGAFTQMITAQRGFQANSRVISTSDEMLQELTNLKR
jgi:flagellar hook protein FlgE